MITDGFIFQTFPFYCLDSFSRLLANEKKRDDYLSNKAFSWPLSL